MQVRILITLLFLACGFFSKSQSRYYFSTLSMDQGLSGNFAWSISQDKYGFMWIGTTNGLNRFDGHSIKQYLHTPKDSFSIPGNILYRMFKDRDGDRWLACGHKEPGKIQLCKETAKRHKA